MNIINIHNFSGTCNVSGLNCNRSSSLRACWRFANLNNSGNAGLAAANSNNTVSNANWNSRPRLSGTRHCFKITLYVLCRTFILNSNPNVAWSAYMGNRLIQAWPHGYGRQKSCRPRQVEERLRLRHNPTSEGWPNRKSLQLNQKGCNREVAA